MKKIQTIKEELTNRLKVSTEIITETPETFVIITPDEQYRYEFNFNLNGGIFISWNGDGNDFDPYEEIDGMNDLDDASEKELLKLIHIALIAKANEPKPKSVIEQLLEKIKTAENKINNAPKYQVSAYTYGYERGELAAYRIMKKWIKDIEDES